MPVNKERSYSLLVGVGRRDNGASKDSDAMAISAEDAINLKKALRQFLFFKDENISLLDNEKAKKDDILLELKNLKEKTEADPADLVVIFFSGHGYTNNDKYYLVCRDTENDDIENTSIEGSLFVEKLKEIKTDKMLVLLDCCHAEGMTNRDIPFDETTFLEQKNRVVITACHRSQVSYLSSPVSIFTYAVIEAIAGKFLIGPDDKEVKVFNLAMDVRERVVALSEQVLKPANIQKPQLNVLEKSGTTNFVIANYPKGGSQNIRFFGEAFSALKSYEGKELEMNVMNKHDDEYRNRFNWMMITNNSTQTSGDGGLNLKDANGNNITVNNIKGISERALIEILKINSKPIEDLLAILQKQIDPDSRELAIRLKELDYAKDVSKTNNFGKVTKDEIALLLDSDIDAALEKMDTLFIKNANYIDLSKEYFAQPNNFSLSSFRSKLKRFLNLNWK
jgi:hypothetical protein